MSDGFPFTKLSESMIRFLISSVVLSFAACGSLLAEGKRPVLISSKLSDVSVVARSAVKVTASFADPEGDFIVDVQVSWRRVGTKGWSQKRMDFVVGSTRGEFEAMIHPTGDGEYEVEFRAADTPDLKEPILGKSVWSGRQTFSSWIPVRNHSPALQSYEVRILDDGRVSMIARFEDENRGDVIVDVQGRWRKRGETEWKMGTLEWVRPTGAPTVFSLTKKLKPGVYDFEVEAADAPLSEVSKHRKSRTGWLSMGEKKITSSQNSKQ